MWWVVGLIVLAVIIVLFIRSTSNIKKKIKEYKAIHWTKVEHVEGLQVPLNTLVDLFVGNDKLIIEAKELKVTIPNDRIIKYAKLTEEDINNIEKSVIGRAVVGGLLLGGIGAIIGGMSGVGTKTKKTEEKYLVINYKSEEGETKVISFKSNLNIDYFVKEFSKTLGQEPSLVTQEG